MGTSVGSLIRAAERGDGGASETLFTTLYSELHSLARRELARRGGQATLGVTTLLHEAYLDMAGRDVSSFPDRSRFLAYAARVMRGLIIDHARNRRALKRGGQFEITSLPVDDALHGGASRELIEVGDALEELAKGDPALAEVVDLKFFCGFSFEEIAEMRGVSDRTVQRMWEKARIYLHRAMRKNLSL